MAKTKKPTGLSVTRDGSKYIIKWKLAEEYESQSLQYRTKGKTDWRKWNDIAVGKQIVSKSVTLSKNNYFPNTDKYLTAVEFRVLGKAENKDKSDWSNKTFDIDIPHVPKVSGGLGDQWNISRFVATIESNDDDSHPYTQYQWQTIRVKESNVTDGSKLSWSTSNLGWDTGTGTSTTLTKTITEDTTVLAQGSRTRWFRLRAKGVAGYTDWKYAKHVFAVPFKPTIKKTSVTEKTSNYLVDVKWEATTNYAHPIDETTVEYAMGIPTANMQPPVSPSWSEADTSKDTKGTDEAVFYTDGKFDDDECLYVRVTAKHDTRENQSDAKLVKKGKLADPSGLSVTVANNVATVQATNNSTACPYTGSDATIKRGFLQVIYKDNVNYPKGINVGVIPYGDSEAQITLPILSNTTGLSYEIGVKAIVGTYTYETKTDGSRRYKIDSAMTSANTIWTEGNLPVAPSGLTYTFDTKLALYWDWSWSDADSAELSWSQNPDAWESTDEPDTYTISGEVNRWFIDELEAGQTYYIRVRLFNSETDVYSPYSDTLEVNLTTPPVKPILSLSNGTIAENGKVTASWNYISGDGTEQEYAEIICDGEIIAHALGEKYITIYAEEQGWTGGSEYSLQMRVKSESGSFSEYSDPVSVLVALPLQAQISTTSLQNVTVTDDTGITRSVLSLTQMPLTIEVSGGDENSVVTIAIERAESYRMDRPDENAFDGYEGETVYQNSQFGADPMTAEVTDLIGLLDDGAKYRIVATIRDELEQSSNAELEFEVHWSHHAIVPNGSVAVDGTVSKVATIAPTGALATDVCDIYRLSADKPELIYPNAEFGDTIVDPYPAINGGYRLVFKTANGDYITDDNMPAWLDIESGFEYDKAIIDFGNDSVEFYYNVDTSHNWSKDFKMTEYLGGAVQGDWNPAVTREGTLDSLVLKPFEPDTIQGLRRLAVYSGICNVRTLDGSSFHANVDVSETNPHDRYGKISEFSLNITRVDAQGYDGVTLDTWEG